MKPVDRAESAVAEMAPATVVRPSPVSLEILDGDEVIQVSLRPSLWYIPLSCVRWLAAVAFLASVVVIASIRSGWRPGAWIALELIVLLGLARVGLSSLQWASRLYVLTNRRVLRFRGVLRVETAQCPLARVGRADLALSTLQRITGVGTLRVEAGDASGDDLAWEHVRNPAEVYRIVTTAIRRAQG